VQYARGDWRPCVEKCLPGCRRDGCVQVNPGSLAENAGLRAGDAVLQINSRPSDELEHEQAKQEIVASGNTVTLVVQRYDALSQLDAERLAKASER